MGVHVYNCWWGKIGCLWILYLKIILHTNVNNPPFIPVIRSTTSADKAIKNFRLCLAALSHQTSYISPEQGRLALPRLSARWRQNPSHDWSQGFLQSNLFSPYFWKGLLFVFVITRQQRSTQPGLENVPFIPDLCASASFYPDYRSYYFPGLAYFGWGAKFAPDSPIHTRNLPKFRDLWLLA